MKTCEFYKRDDEAFNDYTEGLRLAATDNPSPYMEGPEPETLCENFCKYYTIVHGFEDEMLEVCTRGGTRRVINAY